MHTKLKRAALVVSALAAVATGTLVTTGSASALPPGTPASGTAVISPTSGNSGTAFSFNPPAGATCPGVSADGHFWSTFMVPTSVDPATLDYDALGPISQGGAFSQPMYSGGTPMVDQNPATAPAGLIVGVPSTFDFGAYDTSFRPPAGSYYIGFACTLAGETTAFWPTTVTLTDSAGAGPAGFTWVQGLPATAPAAPVLASPLTAGNATCSGSFSATAANPAITGFTVTATPPAPSSPVSTAVGAAGPFTLTGLTNGTAYQVTVTATNSVGTSAPSNAVACTPVEGARPAVQNLQATPGTGQVTVTFAAPTGVAPNDYTLVVTPGPVAGSPFTITGAGPYSQVVSGLAPGTPYTFTVTPNHTAPATGTPASVVATPNAAQVLNQEITVERPAGALILTQRCGVHNALDAFAAVDAFPGFPKALANEAATSNQTGTAPIDDDNAPALDGEFPEYPQPSNPTYPTTCGVTLGVGQLVTTGALAGQYYTAEGFLNEITVLDTRPTNDGWTITGNLDDQFATTGDTFDGNYLGWDPQVGSTTPGQTVAAGPIVLPGTGVGADPALGLADGRTLASAAAGAGNGIAQLDARLLLLIPVAADAGVYNATLTFTAV